MIKKVLLSCALISSIVSGYAIADGFPRMHPKSEDNTATIQPNQSYSLNKIVAIANNDVITQLELNKQLLQAKAALEAQSIPAPNELILEKQVLNQMIIQKLILSLAKKNGISSNDIEVNQALNQIALSNKISISQMKPSIIREYGSIEEYKKTLRNQVIVRKMRQQAVASANIQITHKDVKTFIDKQNANEHSKTEYKIAHILIPIDSEPNAKNIKEARKKAEKALSDIKNGMPFNKAAATYSAAADALKGGELSWKTLGELPDSFQVVSKMNKGQISKLIRTPGGFSIIKLLNKREQKKPVNYTDKYHIKQIVIDITPVTTSLDAKARLLRIRDNLIHSKESFKNLAKANSDDHISSNKGGQLEWVSSNQLNAINPKMAETAAQLKLNEVSEPFKVNNKWYLIKLVGKKKVDNSKELQEQHAQQMLFQKKAMSALETWQSELRGSSYVKILDPRLQ